DELWLAFHGYGQEAEVMQHFMQSLKPNARILSFDLPLHGKTEVRSKFQLTKDQLQTSDLADLVGRILRENTSKRCSLAGFSLGGKLVLKLVELVPGKLDSLLLVAPDGLRMNPFYNFATNTMFGRAAFRLIIKHPGPFFGISKMLSHSGLMHRKVHEFVANQMGTRKKREKVYNSWQMFKNVTPILRDVRSKIWRYHIKPTLVFGKHDKVIHPRLAKKLSGTNCTTAEVIFLNTGHRLLTKENAEILRKGVP
ncbi:MAG: alpha/beta hydrolase, partial [Flavobacteriales bacterium]|nr:alpha/beta hydrolase [Flavobacteriales bacterium]